MTINGNTLTVAPQDTSPQPEGYSLNGWTAAAKKQYLDEWHAAHPEPPAKLAEVETYSAPQGYDDTADHIANFFSAVETREHVVEDEVFGNHAAIACHMANHSYFHRNVATWDASAQTIKGCLRTQETISMSHSSRRTFLKAAGAVARRSLCRQPAFGRCTASLAHRPATLFRAQPAAQGFRRHAAPVERGRLHGSGSGGLFQ